MNAGQPERDLSLFEAAWSLWLSVSPPCQEKLEFEFLATQRPPNKTHQGLGGPLMDYKRSCDECLGPRGALGGWVSVQHGPRKRPWGGSHLEVRYPLLAAFSHQSCLVPPENKRSRACEPTTMASVRLWLMCSWGFPFLCVFPVAA